MAIAWTTVATLVFLLPGFLFFTGFSSPHKFSRDTTPRSAVGQLAGIVFVSFFVHAFLVIAGHIGASAFPSLPEVDLRLVLSALQAGGNGAASISDLSRNMAEFYLAIPLYVGLSAAAGFGIGRLVGTAAVAGPLSFLLEHRWVYQLVPTGGRRFSPAYAYILTKLHEGERHLIYSGPLYQFGLRQDGRFSYLVIRQAERFYLRLEREKPLTQGPGHVIGATRTGGNVEELLQSREIDFLYVDGEEIANVMFERYGFLTPRSVSKTLQAISKAQEEAAGGQSPTPPS